MTVETLLTDPALAREFGAAGRSYAAAFDPGRLVERFEDVLRFATANYRRRNRG